MGKLLTRFTLSFISLMLLGGCGKPYVGRTINPEHPSICQVTELPAECNIEFFEDLTPYVKITEIDPKGIYLVEGYFDPTQGDYKSWAHIEYGQSEFRMLFILDGTIIDNKSLSIIGRSEDIGKKFHFKFIYDADLPFDAITFTYKLLMRG